MAQLAAVTAAWVWIVIGVAGPRPAWADCSLTNVGITPLPDLGFGHYLGVRGGLYPGGANQRPSAHEDAGLQLAHEAVLPRDAAGNVDTNNGKIVLLSVGMSNTTQEFSEFKRRADRDRSRNPQLVIIDGAQGGQDAARWTNVTARAWTNVMVFLSNAGVTSNQVQVLWIKQALAGPNSYGPFPAHAQALQNAVETCLRLAREQFPNLKLAYLSSRTRAYVLGPQGLNPEPFAFEGAFAMKWLIERQIAGSLNPDPDRGPVVAPWLSWGPYLWTFEDGTFSALANPVKQFPAPGIYRPRLTVTDDSGNAVSGAVTVTVTTTLNQWRQANFTAAELANPAISGDEADADLDTIVNRLEYAHGFDPHARDPAGSARPRVALANDRLLLTYLRCPVAADVVFALDVSNDLASWQSAPGLWESAATESSGLTETVTCSLSQSVSATRHTFVRLTVKPGP